MFLDSLLEKFSANREATATIWRDQSFSYGWLLERFSSAGEFLDEHSVRPGDVVSLLADFDPHVISMFLRLVENGNVIVPLSTATQGTGELLEIAQVKHEITLAGEQWQHRQAERATDNKLLLDLRRREHPGLVLFSSGSTGKPKGAVHDFVPLLAKFREQKRAFRTMTFLLFDHIGGVNTMLAALANLGTIVVIEDRNPDYVCALIEKHRVELLPTSPSFLNMILVSGAYERHDLNSLSLVTYGTERMLEPTLLRFQKILPRTKFKQTYGLTELGIMRSRSRDSSSLWMQIGGEDYQTRIVDGILYIKAKTAMLGYLNAPSPFDDDGWFNTEDRVEVDGDWVLILGRESDIINVGGQKVYPADVEAVLLEMDNIADVSVYAQSNPLLGRIVGARINLFEDEPLKALKTRIRKHCRGRLEPYKIPATIEITKGTQVTTRFKKRR